MNRESIVPMTAELAALVAGWRYPEEYAAYNWTEGEPLNSLLDGGSYGVLDMGGKLVGFYQFGEEAKIPVAEGDPYRQKALDVGLGLRPDLCGLGLGALFVEAGLKFARERFGAKAFRLTVADFNQRARRVYERCGFEAVEKVRHRVSGEGFTVMVKEADGEG